MILGISTDINLTEKNPIAILSALIFYYVVLNIVLHWDSTASSLRLEPELLNLLIQDFWITVTRKPKCWNLDIRNQHDELDSHIYVLGHSRIDLVQS